jgi:hypothetical protein
MAKLKMPGEKVHVPPQGVVSVNHHREKSGILQAPRMPIRVLQVLKNVPRPDKDKGKVPVFFSDQEAS